MRGLQVETHEHGGLTFGVAEPKEAGPRLEQSSPVEAASKLESGLASLGSATPKLRPAAFKSLRSSWLMRKAVVDAVTVPVSLDLTTAHSHGQKTRGPGGPRHTT